MQLTIQIPDDLAQRLNTRGSSLASMALEAFAADEYRLGNLTKPDLRRWLGLETSYEFDGFLKRHGIFDDYTLQDFESEREALKALGL